MIDEKNAFKYINFSVLIHFIGRLLYKTFVPIILLSSGYSLNHIYFYLIGYSSITIIFSVFSIKFQSKKNLLFFYIIAIISEIILIILLIPKRINFIVLCLIMLVEGIYYAYYYLSYNSIIIHYTSKEKTSYNLGNLDIISKIANIFAPLIGAFLLIINKYLFIVAAIIFLISSIIPLLKIIKIDINRFILNKIQINMIKYELFSCGIRSGFEFVIFILWPIFVFISGYSLIYVGLIPAFEAISIILLLHTIKKKLVSNKFRIIIQSIAVFGIVIISIFRFFFPEQFIFTNFTIALFYTAFSLSVDSNYFEKIKNFQVYYSSMLHIIISLGVYALLGLITLFIGLSYIILIPVILSLIWFLFSFNNFLKLLKLQK